jgi:SynChlorMet cassette protein ScmD
MPHNNTPVANPLVVLREEFDNWAVLFDPDEGDAFGLNPVGVFVWRLLNGVHKKEDVLKKVRDSFRDVPEEAEEHLEGFLQVLVERGLAGYKVEKRQSS